MWFKNIKLFQLAKEIPYAPEDISEQLAEHAFQPCTATLPMSMGWIAPMDKGGAPLVHAALGNMLICLNIEEKILPATVVREQALVRIKELESLDNRKLSKREKASIKDQVYFTLLQQAFCKNTKIYAYFDTKNNWLLVNCTNEKKLELFISQLKKSLDDLDLHAPETKNIPRLVTHWLLSGQYPDVFAVEENAVLEDFNNTKRVIRCRNQDLFAESIQNLIKDGCVPKQIALDWQERVSFNLNHDFTLTSLKYADSVVEAAKESHGESEAEEFDADFYIMTETLLHLFAELLNYVKAEEDEAELAV